MSTRLTSRFGIGLFVLAAGAGGCGLIEDIIDDIRDPGPGPGAKACASTTECGADQVCSVERGVCNPPPGCDPGEICPAVCYGTCEAKSGGGEKCGNSVCGAGLECCNPSCGICVPPGGACTQQLCDPPTAQCRTDADCRAFSFMCTGCDCLALGPKDPEPICNGPGVLCFADPCLNKKAVCESGKCVIATPAACPAGTVQKTVCLECGIAGGCAKETQCATACKQDPDCGTGQARCLQGLCQVQGCI
jgi:hypothetical protein